ncbi:MAG UNVERIFIED_CONTAM: hypothetical protein LVR18_48565, partial [Planctomycetaceae bacterium]
TITGNSIHLANSGTDVIQVAGENLLKTPLQLDASRIEVSGRCAGSGRRSPAPPDSPNSGPAR